MVAGRGNVNLSCLICRIQLAHTLRHFADVDGLISQSVVSSDKLSTLNQLWEQALADCVRSALADMNGPDDVA